MKNPTMNFKTLQPHSGTSYRKISWCSVNKGNETRISMQMKYDRTTAEHVIIMGVLSQEVGRLSDNANC